MKKIMALALITLLFLANLYGEDMQSAPPKHKVDNHMFKNFIKSLIIPGWGQWENGNKVRSMVYLTAEIAGIYGYKSNYQAGYDKEVDYKAYADEHWYYGRFSPNNDPDHRCPPNLKTHEMPILLDDAGHYLLDEGGFLIPLKDQHYYENISKYPEFVCGWDDIAELYDVQYTPHKLTYIDMRTRSNQLYRNAQVAGTLIMVNHLISAFDAALGTDMTSFESSSFTGKVYINPLNVLQGIRMEVTF